MNRPRLAATCSGVLAAFLLTACPPSSNTGGCSSANCAGCCDGSGVCQLGQAQSGCGKSGASCTACGSGLSCQSGVCSGGSGGGSGVGGGSGTGGGTGTGGGVGQVGQDLVSGTRLRAIVNVGPDGSRYPAGFFWDNQLQIYCLPSAGVVGYFPNLADLCLPIFYVTFSTATAHPYGDSACQVGLAEESKAYIDLYFNKRLTKASLPPIKTDYLLQTEPDGGSAVFAAAAFTGSTFYLKGATLAGYDGGCNPVLPAQQAEYGKLFQATGAELPPSTFVSMPFVRE